MSLLDQLLVARKHVPAVVEVILRVPSLVLVEIWFRQGNDNEMAAFGLNVLMLLVACILASLSYKALISFYRSVAALALMYGGYFLSKDYISITDTPRTHHDNAPFTVLYSAITRDSLLMHSFYQTFLGYIVIYLLGVDDLHRKPLFWMFMFPVLGKVLGLSVHHLWLMHNLATCVVLMVTLIHFALMVPTAVQQLKARYKRIAWPDNFTDWNDLVFDYWHFYRVSAQMMLFWCAIYTVRLYDGYLHRTPETGNLLCFVILSECCGTPFGLIASSVTVVCVSYGVRLLAQIYLHGWKGLQHDNYYFGIDEVFLITGMFVSSICNMISWNGAIVMSAFAYFLILSLVGSVHKIAKSVLLELGTSNVQGAGIHLKVLSLFAVLWFLPVYMTYHVSVYIVIHNTSLMFVISCIVFEIIQITETLLLYLIFSYDTSREESLEWLDDFVCYTGFAICILHYIAAFGTPFMFLLIKGPHSSSYTWETAAFLTSSCYFSLYHHIGTCLETHLQRRESVRKIAFLPQVSVKQLAAYGFRCAICYQPMSSARITQCNHLFHGFCLGKWVYVRDACPTCDCSI